MFEVEAHLLDEVLAYSHAGAWLAKRAVPGAGAGEVRLQHREPDVLVTNMRGLGSSIWCPDVVWRRTADQPAYIRAAAATSAP